MSETVNGVVESSTTEQPTQQHAIEPKKARDPMPFEPRNVEEAWRMAEWLSKSSLLPGALRGKPSDVLVVMMKGRELGLQPMVAFSSIHVIDGKPNCSAELLAGLVKASPACEYFQMIDSSDEQAVFESKRRGAPKPVRMAWTAKQAEAAGLLGKDNWKRHRGAMLRARCIAALCRAEWQDVTMGLETVDEAEERREAEKAVTGEATTTGPAPASKVVALAERVAAKVAEKKPAPTPPAQQETPKEEPPAPVPTVGFGPAKGRPVSDLSADELTDSIDLAEARLKKEPNAPWASALRENLQALQDEQAKRIDEAGGAA